MSSNNKKGGNEALFPSDVAEEPKCTIPLKYTVDENGGALSLSLSKKLSQDNITVHSNTKQHTTKKNLHVEEESSTHHEKTLRQHDPTSSKDGDRPTKRSRTNMVAHDDSLLRLQKIWETKSGGGKDDSKEAIQETFKLISNAVNDLVKDGIHAHQELERSNLKLKAVTEDCASKGREIERLRAAEKKSGQSIKNLLQTIRSSNEETKDSSQAKLIEARIRADLLSMTSQRNDAEVKLADAQSRCSRLNSELLEAKMTASRAQQEKKQIEQYQRVAAAQAKSLQGDKHSELDYYRRKSKELQTQTQGLQTVLAEKNRVIEELRRQHERNLSQNRLAAYRSGGANHKKRT